MNKQNKSRNNWIPYNQTCFLNACECKLNTSLNNQKSYSQTTFTIACQGTRGKPTTPTSAGVYIGTDSASAGRYYICPSTLEKLLHNS